MDHVWCVRWLWGRCAGGVCVHSVWEEKLRVKGGRGFTVGVSETRYEPIWVRECLSSPTLCLTYCALTAELIAGHGDGEIHVWDAHAPNLGLVSLTHFVGHKFSQVS
jgi:hypothetical protein